MSSTVPHRHKKLSILQSALGEYYRQGDEYLFYCPFCSHRKRKLSINLKKDVAKCWVCKWATASLAKLVSVVGDEGEKMEWNEIDDSVDIQTLEEKIFKDDDEESQIVRSLPDGYKPLAHSYNEEAIKYLTSRGLDLDDVYQWQIGYADDGRYEGRVIFPSFDRSGQVNYYVARSFVGDGYPKYMTADGPHTEIVFNELYINWDEPVRLVEGVFDAVKASPNSIPLLGNFLHEDSELMSALVKKDPEVYVALDSDASAQQRNLLETLIDYGITSFSVDIGEYEDVGDMPREDFEKAVDQAIHVTQAKIDRAILTQ